MDHITVIRHVLERIAGHLKCIPKPGVETNLIEDPEQKIFLLQRIGWHDGKRVNNVVIFARVRDDKVWVEDDNTDLCFAEELVPRRGAAGRHRTRLPAAGVAAPDGVRRRVTAPHLADAVPRVRANVRRVFGEYDVFLWHARANKFFRDGPVGPVELNPNLSVDDVEMEHHAVYAALSVPSEADKFKVIEDRIEYDFAADRPARLCSPDCVVA